MRSLQHENYHYHQTLVDLITAACPATTTSMTMPQRCRSVRGDYETNNNNSRLLGVLPSLLLLLTGGSCVAYFTRYIIALKLLPLPVVR